MIVLYLDNCNAIFDELERKAKLNDEGTMKYLLGMLIAPNDNGAYIMSQSIIINCTMSTIFSMKDAKSTKLTV